MKLYVLVKKNSKRLVTDKAYRNKKLAEEARTEICNMLADQYGNGLKHPDKTALANKYAEWINVTVLTM